MGSCVCKGTASAFERFAAALNAALRECGQHFGGILTRSKLTRCVAAARLASYSPCVADDLANKRLALLWTVA